VRKADERWSGSPASPQCGRSTKVSTRQLFLRVHSRTLTESTRSPESVETGHVGVHVVDPTR
jgi:hypothetical protein